MCAAKSAAVYRQYFRATVYYFRLWNVDFAIYAVFVFGGSLNLLHLRRKEKLVRIVSIVAVLASKIGGWVFAGHLSGGPIDWQSILANPGSLLNPVLSDGVIPRFRH